MMGSQWFMLAVTLTTTCTLQTVASQQVATEDKSDFYLNFVKGQMVELLRHYNASPGVLTQLENSNQWNWRTWDQTTANQEFDLMLAAVRSTFRPRVPAGDAGTALSLTDCHVDNLGTGWYRVGDVTFSQSATRSEIKFTIANRSVKADCDYWFLGTGKANAVLKHVEVEMASHLNMKTGSSPIIDVAKVRQFSGVETDFGSGFWAPGLNLVVGLVASYSQDRIITELEQQTPGFFQEQMNSIKLP